MSELSLVDSMIANVYSSGGTNKPAGFKAGDFMIPGQFNRGVATCNVFPSNIYLIPLTTILTFRMTANDPQSMNIPLFNATEGNRSTVVQYSPTSLALKLASVTQITVTSVEDAQFTATVSGYDRYLQKSVSAPVSDSNQAVTNCCFQYLTNLNITLSAPLTGDDTITFNLQIGGSAELPYTDYNLKELLYNVVSSYTDEPYILLSGLEADLTASWKFQYQAANWSDPVTATSGTPRPIISYNLSLSELPSTKLLSVQQMIFPTNEFPKSPSLLGHFSEDELTNVIGLPNYTTGWVNWGGGE